MAKKYFLKELVAQPIIATNGRPVPFELLAQDYGVIALDEDNPEQAALILDLEKARAQRIGGIVPISESEYTQKKSSMPYQASRSRSEPLQAFPSRLDYRLKAAQEDAAVAVADNGNGSTASPTNPPVPTPLPPAQPPIEAAPVLPADFKPKTARLKRPSVTLGQ
jgi:hypothetical protein